MLRSLFVLALVGMMMGVGYYYDRMAGSEVEANTATITGTAILDPVDHETRGRSGVDLTALDRDTRPQDDFYQFVNGGWLDSTEIPEIYSGYTVYHEVREKAQEALLLIIEDAADEPGEAGTESQQVGDIYSSWMDSEAIDRLGIEPIRPQLDLIESVENRAGLTQAMAELRRLGVGTPYSFYLYPDLKQSTEYAVYFGQSGITMPNRDYYLDQDNDKFNKAREALPAYISAMLQRAGSTKEASAAASQAIYALEESIAKAHWDSVTNRDPEKAYNPYSLAELSQLGSHFNWTSTLDELQFGDVEKVIIRQPSYFEALDQMLASVPLETWKNYLKFRLMDSSAFHLDQGTSAIRFDYRNRVLRGQEQPEPRWKLGVSLVDDLVGEAVGKLYVQEHFPPEAKEKMELLVDNVIATLDDSLQELEWMSPETRLKAREKLSTFTPKIGYPDVWKDYSDLQIIRGDHVGNVRRAQQWQHQQDVARLGQPVDRNEWFMTPQTVNAYYSPARNEIVFPAARLQPPFFQLDADDAINYGAVGGVIGHEISHGFDDKGSKFNGEGNLSNWWTDEDREAFEQRTAALVEQFNAYEPVEGMNINGEFTLGENIGDLSGVAMAYRAYVRSLDGQEAPILDGFTGAQRFFIGYAMSRKGKYREEATINRLASDPHSPLKYRVNGPYPNIDAFHEAWGTQAGDGMWMSPGERVRLW